MTNALIVEDQFAKVREKIVAGAIQAQAPSPEDAAQDVICRFLRRGRRLDDLVYSHGNGDGYWFVAGLNQGKQQHREAVARHGTAEYLSESSAVCDPVHLIAIWEVLSKVPGWVLRLVCGNHALTPCERVKLCRWRKRNRYLLDALGGE